MSRGSARVPRPIAGKCQSVASGARTANAIGEQVFAVLLNSEDGGHYALGGSGVTASTADTRIMGEHLIRCAPGEYVAFNGTGTLYVSEMSE